MDEHELVSEVKRLAVELGRSPTRPEFCAQIKGAEYKLTRFGGFTALLQAAGLETYSERRNKKQRITNEVFEAPIERHLEAYRPRVVADRKPYPTIATISDIHFPFESRRVIDRFLECVGDKKHEYVILNGDAWDMYAMGKFPRSHNIFTPREEQDLSRRKNEELWAEVRRRSPKSKLIQMMGNHDVRPLRRILEVMPAAEDWISEKLTALFTFEGVETIMDPRQELMIADIAIFHGYRARLGDHRDHVLMNTINGHTHRGGTVFRTIGDGRLIWELNSGLAGDPEAKGLTYTPGRITGWTLGFGEVDRDGPRFIPA